MTLFVRLRALAILGLLSLIIACVPQPPIQGQPRSESPASATEPAIALDPANPFAGQNLFTWTASRTAQAAAAATDEWAKQVFTRLADTPTAVWLVPEEHPVGDVGLFVGEIVEQAALAKQVPVFVVYGISNRDCTGGHSAGGLPRGAYLSWLNEIGLAIQHRAVVVLEPDAVASAPSCSATRGRLKLLRQAVRLISGSAPTYVDAGHGRWLPVDQMATLLRRAGVRRAHGFSVNVSSYGSLRAEKRYATAIQRSLGGGGFVIDGGRTGGAAPKDWCNPDGALVGAAPYVDANASTPLDAVLWVKPPGESDGTCNGGPPAGEFWPERALALAAASGW